MQPIRTVIADACRACLRKSAHAGGNGKQIFGDAWWLEPEEDARLAVELAGAPAQGIDSHLTGYTAAKGFLGVQGETMSVCSDMTCDCRQEQQCVKWKRA